MPAWEAFVAIAIGILVFILVLARKSQRFIHDYAEETAERADGESLGKPGSEEASAASTDGEVTAPPSGDDGDGQAAVASSATDVSAGESPGQTTAVGEHQSSQPTDPTLEEVEEAGEANAAIGEDRHNDQGSAELASADDADQTSTAEGYEPLEGDIETAVLEDTTTDTSLAAEVTLTPRMLLANVAFTQALVTAGLLAAAWYFAIPADAFGVTAEPLSTGVLGVAVGILFGVSLWIGNEGTTYVADAVGAAYDETVRNLLAPNTANGWLFLYLVVLPLISVSEELLFRAALIGVPAAGFGVSPWPLAIASSVAFALGHGAQGRVGVVVTGLLGFLLAGGYIVTGSLLVVIVAHYVINAMEFTMHELLGVELP